MKALYVDFDGTLTNDRYWRSLLEEEYKKVQDLLFGNDKTLVSEWMRGRYTAEEINRFLEDKLNLPYEYLWKIFVTDCETLSVSRDTLNCVSQLKSEYVTVLMTGNMDSFSRFTVPALKLDSHFCYISNSYNEGIHKTDNNGELFRIWADKLNIKLEDSILIDDQEKVCDTFDSLGGISHKVSSVGETFKILSSL